MFIIPTASLYSSKGYPQSNQLWNKNYSKSQIYVYVRRSLARLLLLLCLSDRTENPSRVLCVHACGISTALCVRSLTRFSPARAFFCAARAAQRKIAGARFYSAALFASRFMALRHGNSLIATHMQLIRRITRTQTKCARAHKNAINAQYLGHRPKVFLFFYLHSWCCENFPGWFSARIF
jgi:hypothetical protein